MLNLGVISQPYRHTGPRYTGRGRAKHKRSGATRGISTYEVARILEHKYHVMEHFYRKHEDEITQIIMDDLDEAALTAQMGGPAELAEDSSGMQKIRAMFNTFLDSKEIETMGVAGVPTKAALHGVSHRFKHPYARRGPRPSFIDTGLYEASFRAWVD
jgi:hypothetical protein